MNSWGFRLYVGVCSADVLGDALWLVGLTWAVSGQTGAASAAAVLAAASVPRVALLLPAGVLVDRLGAMPVAQSSQAIRICLMAVLTLLLLGGVDSVPILLVASACFGIADALRMPADGSLLPAVLTPDSLPAGQGVLSVIYRFGSVIGSPIAGLLLAWTGFHGITAADTALFALGLLGFAALARRGKGVRTEDVQPETSANIRSGLRYVWNRRRITLMLAVVSVINLASAGPLELGIALVARQHSWGGTGVGVSFAAFSAGATLGALSLARWRPTKPVRAGYLCAAASGAAILVLPWGHALIPTLALLIVAGAGFGPAGGLLLGSIQAATDTAHLGRVMSLVSFSSTGLSPLGLVLFGVLAGRLGTTLALMVCGVVILFAALAAVASTIHTDAAPHKSASGRVRTTHG